VTTLANSLMLWIGLLAGLGGLYVLPTVIAVFRRVENIAVVAVLTCLPIAWPAALVVAWMMPGGDDQ
jgi:hypothetical protein